MTREIKGDLWDYIEKLYSLKKKIEFLFEKIYDKYDIIEYMSNKLKFRIDYELMFHDNKIYKLYKNNRTLNGDIIPYADRKSIVKFDDWVHYNIPELYDIETIYEKVIKKHEISKLDIIKLNKIYNQHFSK